VKILRHLYAWLFWVFFAFAMVCAAMGFCVGRATAQEMGDHGVGHAENHNWYKGLQSPMGFSCCNAMTSETEGDCRPVRAFYDGEQWKALVDGKWEAVPANVVLPDNLNKDPLHAHACRSRGGTWYCFLPGKAGG
jgi:hypothetical protein